MSDKKDLVIDEYRLSKEGQDEHSKLSVSCFRTFLFWAFVGNCAGFTVGKFLPILRPSLQK